MLKIQIEGNAKEIAALVQELQERQGIFDESIDGEEISHRLQASLDQGQSTIGL